MNLNNIIPIDESGRIHLFGFVFYTDDLLILVLILFLYKQQVNDKFIYIALLALLLSK